VLPKIELPKFIGSNTAEWLTFKKEFEAMLAANPALEEYEILEFLKQAIYVGKLTGGHSRGSPSVSCIED
jgi:hypothetical protein